MITQYLATHYFRTAQRGMVENTVNDHSKEEFPQNGLQHFDSLVNTKIDDTILGYSLGPQESAGVEKFPVL